MEQTRQTTQGTRHRWQFFRAGGFDQVLVRDGQDLAALAQLDKKLWATLSCPVKGLEFDENTLRLIDEDGDGRIRAPEMLAAIEFCKGLLKNLDPVAAGDPALALEAIDDSHEAGQALLASAQHALRSLDKAESGHISVEDIQAMQAKLAQLARNGDGIVPPSAVDDETLRERVEEIIACVGGELDRGGELGVSEEKLVAFFEAARARHDWLKQAQSTSETILPLGAETAAAFEALQAVRTKIDDFFVRGRLAAYDARAIESLHRSEADYVALAARELSAADAGLADFPLALQHEGDALSLVQGINPAWVAAINRFHSAAVEPVLGECTKLDAAGWEALQTRFAPYEGWLSSEEGHALSGLDQARLAALIEGEEESRIKTLIDLDYAEKPTLDALEQVEKLARYVRDLASLLRNYASFADFYSGERKAVFQAGTLYLDQRSCELCIQVNNLDTHAAMAGLSHTYLVYCECRRRGGDEQMTIAAAVTVGDVNGLAVGRNGLFIDRQGQDWDATVTQIIEQPISIRQAFADPYKRLARFIGEQIKKIASSKADSVNQSLAGGVEKAAEGSTPAPFDVAKFAGIFAAIGLAIGAIGTALAALLSSLLSLPAWQIPLVFLALIAIISGPSMFIAWLKLRQRNLAPLLDANGWAINTRARINIPFGKSLTDSAELPPGSVRSLSDPYAKKSNAWILYLLLALALAGLAYWFWQQGLSSVAGA